MATQAEIDTAQAELDVLIAARADVIAGGEEVRIDSRMTRYSSLDSLEQAITRARNRVRRLSGRGPRQVVPA